MMKKLFVMLLMVALCSGLVMVANATESGSFVDSQNRTGYWSLDDAGILVISGNADIPSQSIAPYTVHKSNIKFIIIKEGVQTIHTDAFSDYYALRSIIIPDSVNTIHHGIFNYCYNLESIVYHGIQEPKTVASDFL